MDFRHLREIRPNLERRAALWRSVRTSLDEAGFLEVETDVRIPAPAPEEYIESVCAEGEFLRASPELAMKVLLAAGYGKIWQIGRCFRADEYGSRHRTEFTMLEFYAANWDYRELARFTAEFIRDAAHRLFGTGEIPFRGQTIDLDAEPEYLTVAEAYRRYAPEPGDFDELMVTKVEPNLGKVGITFLIDYPANRASLSRLSAADPRVAERWEVYISGIELGNAFGELVDAAEQKRRFAEAYKFRAKQGMKPYPEPLDFYAALEAGIPEASGCAVGVDRLAMILCDAPDIASVRWE